MSVYNPQRDPALMPKRLRVIDSLTRALGTISVANGYTHDIIGGVWRGRTKFGENDQVPMLSILESPNPDIGLFAGVNSTSRKDNWTLYLQGWGSDDPLNPTDPAYYLAADVEKCLSRVMMVNSSNGRPAFPDIYLLGRTINGLELAPPVVRPPDELSTKAYFYLPVRIDVSINLVDPYCS